MRVENTTRSGVFLTNFEGFGNVFKHCLSCLTCFLNQNLNEGENGELQSLKSMLVKIRYPAGKE